MVKITSIAFAKREIHPRRDLRYTLLERTSEHRIPGVFMTASGNFLKEPLPLAHESSHDSLAGAHTGHPGCVGTGGRVVPGLESVNPVMADLVA